MKKLAMSNKGLQIIDPDTMATFANKKLSNSLIDGINGCRARWLFSTYTPMVEVVDSPLSRGSWFHYIMEQFYKLPANERTKDNLHKILINTKSHDKFSALYQIPAAKDWLKQCLKGYYELGAKPQQVKIALLEKTKLNGDPYLTPGLEIFVDGKLGSAKREVLGFIDQLSVSKDNKLQVLDWKTGATAKRYSKSNKNDDGWSECRQQILYTQMLRQYEQHKVNKAVLVYPLAKTVVQVPINDKELIKKAIVDVEQADQALDELNDSNEFTYKPSFLCSWCPLVNICPKAQRGSSSKMRAAQETQPTLEEVSEVLEML